MRYGLLSRSARSIPAAVVILLGFAILAGAATDAEKCESLKAGLLGKYAFCLAKAEKVLALKQDETRHGEMVLACGDKLAARWEPVEVLYGTSCPFPDDLLDTPLRTELHVIRIARHLSGSPFVDNGDGTILDYATGLMWEKKGPYPSLGVHDGYRDWTWNDGIEGEPYEPNGDVFLEFLATLNGAGGGDCFADYCDWRLPTLAELQGLWEADEVMNIAPIFRAPCLVNCIWPNCSCTLGGQYWTGNTCGSPECDDEGRTAWVVDFGQDRVAYESKRSWALARAVRDVF